MNSIFLKVSSIHQLASPLGSLVEEFDVLVLCMPQTRRAYSSPVGSLRYMRTRSVAPSFFPNFQPSPSGFSSVKP